MENLENGSGRIGSEYEILEKVEVVWGDALLISLNGEGSRRGREERRG